MKTFLIISILFTCSLAQVMFDNSESVEDETDTDVVQVNTRFFGLIGKLFGKKCKDCGCGRKRRQAPGEDEPGTRFFGKKCCDCPATPAPPPTSRCECNYNLTYRDRYGHTHGACKKADNSGRRWCYTTGVGGCSDSRPSHRFPNNSWSYLACNFQG